MRTRPVLGAIAAIALSALVLWVALALSMGGVVVVLFGQWLGLVILLVAVAGAAAAIAAIVFAFTGRRRIGAAVAVTLLAFIALGFAFFGFGTVPMIWVQPGFELVNLLIAVPAAVVLALFIARGWARIVGAVGVLLLIGGAIWVSIPDPSEVGPTAEELAQEQMDANFEAFVDAGSYPMVADLPGGTIVGFVRDGGPARTLTVTAEGGAVEVVYDPNPISSNPDIAPCWYLAAADMGLNETDTLADYSSWCIRDGDIWKLTDGTGYARMSEGSLVAVRSAIAQNVDLAGAERAASASEVLEAWNALRPMTETEVRQFMRPGVDGISQ